jgi:hypothetical protein
MTTLKQLRDAANLEGINKISEIAMSAEDNASDTLIEKGCVKGNNSWGGPFDYHPEFVGYWIGSIRSILSSDTHSDDVVEYFASIGVSA